MSSGVRNKLLKLSLVLVTAFGACTLAQEAPVVDALKVRPIKSTGFKSKGLSVGKPASKGSKDKFGSGKPGKKQEQSNDDDSEYDGGFEENVDYGDYGDYENNEDDGNENDLDGFDDNLEYNEDDVKPKKNGKNKKNDSDGVDDDLEYGEDDVKPKKNRKSKKNDSDGDVDDLAEINKGVKKKGQAKNKKLVKKTKLKKENEKAAPVAEETKTSSVVDLPPAPVVAESYKLYSREAIVGLQNRLGIAENYYNAKELSKTETEKPPMILRYQEADLENKTANGSLAQRACIYFSPTFFRKQYKFDDGETFNKISFEITDSSGNKYTYLNKNDKYIKGPFPIGDFIEIELALGFDNFDENLTVSPGFWLRDGASYLVKLYAGEEIDEKKLMAQVNVDAKNVGGCWIEAFGFNGGLAYFKEGGELLQSFKHPSVFDFNYYNTYFARITINGLKRLFN